MYLDDTITNCEIVAANYSLYRLDKNCPGVIAVLNKYTCPQFDRADDELLWIQIHIGTKPVMFGVFYRSP